MEHDPWLVKEAGRVTQDLRDLQTDLSLFERKYQIRMSDKDKTIVLGDNEWTMFQERIKDACEEMIEKLDDFVDNEFGRQLHWSALRMLTASGVLSAELKAYREKLNYIARHPSNNSADVNKIVNWFEARIEPLYGRLSVRLVQIMSRVLNPESWEVSTDLTDLSSGNVGGHGSVRLKLCFEPNTEDKARIERERIKRLRRLQLDAEDD